MARGGYRPGAGRKPKTEVQPNIEDIAAALESGELIGGDFENAKEFLKAVYTNPLLPLKDRMTAATIAIPYESAKVGEEKQGKKAAKAEAAQNAGNDSEWGDDLKTRKLTVVK